MELLEKLFTKRKLDDNNHESRDRARSSQITEEQVRLLLFRESDWRGRKVLFDSSTIERVFSGTNDKPFSKHNELPCILEVSEGFSYVYKGPASDTSLLGEMIFGAVSLSYKGASLKIHLMDEPRRLMCSKVFCVPVSRRRTDGKSHKANSSGELYNTSKPLIVPSEREDGGSTHFSFNRGDSGYCEEQTPYSSYGSTNDYFSMLDTWEGGTSDEYSFHSPSGRKLSVSSNGSWQRRTFRSMATRFDLSQSINSLTVPYANGQSSDPQMCSNSTASTSDSFASGGSVASQRRNKLGLALLITVTEHTNTDLVQKCSELSPQLQALVCRLRLAAVAAGANSTGGFISTLYRATTDAAKWLSDLLYGPRTPPMWLNLVTSEQHHTANKLAESLLADICFVLSVGDTKNTKFFMSTLVTYVLTYHLGWVSTVSPYESEGPPRAYNALWAQLNDLTGTIGYPPTIARTIVCGTSNMKFINRLLVVLTYFIRCGDIKTSDFGYKNCSVNEGKVINVDCNETVPKSMKSSKLSVNTQVCSASTFSSDASIKRLPTFLNISDTLSNMDLYGVCGSSEKATSTGGLKRNQTVLIPQNYSDSSEESSISDEIEVEQKVIFVLGDNEKLVGLKNKSNGGKSVKRSSKTNEPLNLEVAERLGIAPKETDQENHARNSESPSKCCSQTLQHSKPIKHSGFKFEFDKYPQIVTNYMKSKNLEILDRHYIGKPGNLKLDNFQFDPTVVPPIQEERCETCYKCQLMESMLQTPTNASELEYMNDVPRQSEPQYAKESVVKNTDTATQISPKTFIRKCKENTIVVNVTPPKPEITVEKPEKSEGKEKSVKRVVEFPMGEIAQSPTQLRAGFDASLLGAVTDHYVPDLVLQGTTAKPNTWETQLQRDLELTLYMNKSTDEPIQAVGIIGDTNTWDVRIVSREHAASGMSTLVAAMLEVLPAMWRAKVPAHQCLSFLEDKLRELCVLSKTLADILMSTDFCDIATLTKSLNIDVTDVPLLLAVATTHSPQVAKRYGISYR